jgi:trk system potassium uptake protein TrkH
VIRPAFVGSVIGQFLLMLGASMLVPITMALIVHDSGLVALAGGLLCTWGAGAILVSVARRHSGELSLREGLLVVVAVWVAVALFGSLPYALSPHFASFGDAFFESMSGFTTTGATVLDRVEVLPGSLQLWRCLTHWIGGMGIIVLGVAILPLLGVGGMHLYRAEFSGARSEKLTPRIAETALALWKIYVALTLAQYIALRAAGMQSFEAVLHSLSTLATGGFSNRTASVGGFNSPLIEYIIVLFMLLAGINFTRHYRLWIERRPGSFFRDVEVRMYLALVLVSTLAITLNLILESGYSAATGLRAALFQASSIMTTTGFVTDDFERWPPMGQLILLALMFAGGCTGSTAGGLKISRLVILMRIVSRELKKMVHRRGVFAIRVGEQVIPESSVQSLLNMVYLAFMINFTACLILAATGVDVLTSISAVAACMFNIGPGLGGVGPSEHFGHLPAIAKWVLSGCMLAGRLEFYTALVIFTPTFWRR